MKEDLYPGYFSKKKLLADMINPVTAEDFTSNTYANEPAIMQGMVRMHKYIPDLAYVYFKPGKYTKCRNLHFLTVRINYHGDSINIWAYFMPLGLASWETVLELTVPADKCTFEIVKSKLRVDNCKWKLNR